MPEMPTSTQPSISMVSNLTTGQPSWD